jgi:hypothetical protein
MEHVHRVSHRVLARIPGALVILSIAPYAPAQGAFDR